MARLRRLQAIEYLYSLKKEVICLLTIKELQDYLENSNSNFEILTHDTPIVSTQDAAKCFDIEKAAPTFIMDTEQGLVALIVSSKRGKLDFKAIKRELGFSRFTMANEEKTQNTIGYKIGNIPLIGHNLPCVFDDYLLDYDFIFGGSGEELSTLKISPKDVLRLNNVIKHIGLLLSKR